jgi:Na+/H+ antiporter NhaD/arsenite permease-like protein
MQAASDVVPGADLALVWALPFAALLLSIALLPPLAPSFWHRHYGKVALASCAMLVVPLGALRGIGVATHEVLDALLVEFLPFIILLFALSFALEGRFNLVLLAGVIAAVVASGAWRPGVAFEVEGLHFELQNIVRDAALLALALISLWRTPARVRAHNAFTFAPIAEVAKLFAALFVTIAPVIAMLQAGPEGAFAPVVALVRDASGAPRNAAVFVATGALSAYLDNAPTYLVFFNLFGGDAAELTTRHASTLTAISMAAVYCGALTYIGNAPNLMVRSIAEERGVPMPSFFAYFGWSLLLMAVPLAVIAALL